MIDGVNFEKVLIYAPLISVFGGLMAGAALSAAGFVEKNFSDKICFVVAAFILGSFSFILVYQKSPVEMTGGLPVVSSYISGALIVFALIFIPAGQGYRAYLFRAGAVAAAALSGHPAVLMTAFFAAGGISGKRSFFYIIAGIAFAVMASLNQEILNIQAQKLGLTGLLFVMIMDSAAARISMGAGSEGSRADFAVVSAVQLFIMLRLICGNAEYISVYGAGTAGAVVLAFSFFKAVTEEKFPEFMEHSLAMLFMLAAVVFIFTVSGEAAVSPAVFLYAFAGLGAVIFSQKEENRKVTVSGFKYNPEKAYNIRAAAVFFLSAAALEVFLFFRLCEEARNTQAVKAIMIFAAMIYITGMLNKFFIAVSAAARFKAGSDARLVLNKESSSIVVFAVFSAVVLIAAA